MMQTLPIGYMLEHKYRVIKLLGQGAFGATYLVEHTHFQTKHVIKEYLPDSAVRNQSNTILPKSQSDEETFTWGLKRFFDEAKLLYRLNHPNIVKVSDLFEAHGTAYFVMPYLGSHTFHDWINQHRQPKEQDLLSIVIPLLEGLKYIHSQGLLHRDIKPENIIITNDNTPIFIDFGSARNAIGKKSKLLTRVLTPHYAPIEQYSQNTEFSVALDLYSLASSLYQAIVDDYPPVATDRVMNDTIIKLAETAPYNNRYSQHFLQAIDINLNLYAKDRHQSANDMQNLLLGFDESIIPESIQQKQKTPTLNDDEIRAWQESCRVDSIESYQYYISIYPVGRFVKEARQIIQQKQEIEEREIWKQANNIYSIESYNYYLSLYPHGLYSAQAKKYLRELEQAEQFQQQESYDEQEKNEQYSKTYNPTKPKKGWNKIALFGAVFTILALAFGSSYYSYSQNLDNSYNYYQTVQLDYEFAYDKDSWQRRVLDNPDILDDEVFAEKIFQSCKNYKPFDKLKMKETYSIMYYDEDKFNIESDKSYAMKSSLKKDYSALKSRINTFKGQLGYDFNTYQQKVGSYTEYLNKNGLDNINERLSKDFENIKKELDAPFLVAVLISGYVKPKISHEKSDSYDFMYESGMVIADFTILEQNTNICYQNSIIAFNSDEISKVSINGIDSDINDGDLVDDLMQNLKKEFEKSVNYKAD